jgi:hypothetical protein
VIPIYSAEISQTWQMITLPGVHSLDELALPCLTICMIARVDALGTRS